GAWGFEYQFRPVRTESLLRRKDQMESIPGRPALQRRLESAKDLPLAVHIGQWSIRLATVDHKAMLVAKAVSGGDECPIPYLHEPFLDLFELCTRRARIPRHESPPISATMIMRA